VTIEDEFSGSCPTMSEMARRSRRCQPTGAAGVFRRVQGPPSRVFLFARPVAKPNLLVLALLDPGFQTRVPTLENGCARAPGRRGSPGLPGDEPLDHGGDVALTGSARGTHAFVHEDPILLRPVHAGLEVGAGAKSFEHEQAAEERLRHQRDVGRVDVKLRRDV
jgi:hypothetical protein